MRRHLSVLWLLTLCVACRNPVSPGSAHLEAIELQLRDGTGRVIAATIDNARWTGGPLRVASGDTLPLLAEFTDVFGDRFTLEGRTEHTLRAEVEAPRTATWTTNGARGRLTGILAGTTRIRFHIWHGTHADFSSPWIAVEVATLTASASTAR